jgi:hypothetical protein
VCRCPTAGELLDGMGQSLASLDALHDRAQLLESTAAQVAEYQSVAAGLASRLLLELEGLGGFQREVAAEQRRVRQTDISRPARKAGGGLLMAAAVS